MSKRKLACSAFTLIILVAFQPPALRAGTKLDVRSLTKFIDRLPNPLDNTLEPVGTLDGAPLFDVRISQFEHRLHSEIPPTTVWGYNESIPGPTFDVQRDTSIRVRWTNELTDAGGTPRRHFLPYDTTIHGAGPQFPQARTVTHLHGAVTDEQSDGYPEHWFTPDPLATANGMGGPAGNQHVTTYPNRQRAAGLWYHDHAMGITRLNVYAGLAGAYLIRDDVEAALDLPSGAYEIPMILQDRSFHEDGSLFYPGSESESPHVPFFLADANVVNGVVWPFLEVEPRKYRFRFLNAANSRSYDLSIVPDPGAASTDPLTLHQVGTDGGLLATRVERPDMKLFPADRTDVVVDFSNFLTGDTLRLRNGGPGATPGTTDEVLQFRVIESQGPDDSQLPTQLSTITRYDAADATRVRRLELVRSFDEQGRIKLLLDGKRWTDEISETVVRGDLEIWELVNTTAQPHPIHLHLEAFQILDREGPFGAIPLEAYEQGWEDTFAVNAGETVRFMVKFDQYTGTFVWHCHILEHEDHEMMRPFRIVTRIVPEANAAVIAWLVAAGAGFVTASRGSRVPIGVVAVGAIVVVATGAGRTAAQTYYAAHLDADQVVGQSPPTTATATASFMLTADESELHYTIEIHGLDLDPDPEDRTDPNDVVGIHLHAAVPDTTGPHVLNIFGTPREDDADLVVDYARNALRGIYDASDAIDPLTGEPFFQFFPLTTKFIGSYIDELNRGELYVAVHTVEAGGGPAIRGHIRPVIPEPSAMVLLAPCLLFVPLFSRETRS